MHQGCQVPFLISRENLGFLLRSCSGKGPHLAMTGEPRGFSRVGAGFSGYDGELREPLVLPQGSPISIGVARGSWGLLSSHCRANRPHEGLFPETPCSSPVVTGPSGMHSRFTWRVRPRLEWNQRTALLSSCNGYLLEPIECPEGSQASCGVLREDSGLPSRPCRKSRASCRNDGGISWFIFELLQDMWGFSRFDGELREPLVWPQGSQISIRDARGSVALLSSQGSGIGPQDALKGESRGLS